jgi:formate transporter
VVVAGAVALTWLGYLSNLFAVILGHIVGGSVLVSLVYYVIFRRKSGREQTLRAAVCLR